MNVIDKVRFKRNTQNKNYYCYSNKYNILYLTRSLVIIRSMIIILKNMRTFNSLNKKN